MTDQHFRKSYRAKQLCQRGLGDRNSVCPSVRPSQACFVTKRKNKQLKF